MKRAREFGVLGMVFALGSLSSADDPVKGDDPPTETPKVEEIVEPSARSTWEYLSEKYDADSDGKISPKEYGRDETHFKRLDIDADGFIAKAEIEERDRSARNERGGGFGGGRGAGGARGGRRGPQGEGGERPERTVAPLEGSEAPDFELLVLAESRRKQKEETKKEDIDQKGGEEVPEEGDSVAAPKKLKLSSFKGERPVALIFGSYT